MKVSKERILKIEVSGKNADNLESALKKITEPAAGFQQKSGLEDKEMKVLKDIKSKL